MTLPADNGMKMSNPLKEAISPENDAYLFDDTSSKENYVTHAGIETGR